MVTWFASLFIGLIPLIKVANKPGDGSWRLSLWFSLGSTIISFVGVYLFFPAS